MSAHKRARTEKIVAAVEVDEYDSDGGGSSNSREDEEEEALVALIEHRAKEVEHNRKRIAYYQSQLQESEKRLQDSQSKLVRVRRRKRDKQSTSLNGVAVNGIKLERQSVSPTHSERRCSEIRPQLKPKLVISSKVELQPDVLPLSHSDNCGTSQADKSVKISSQVNQINSQTKELNLKIAKPKMHTGLIPYVKSNSSPSLIHCDASAYVSSNHKRKLRSLILCPVNDNLFMTSGLDGLLNLWQLQDKESGASLMSSTDCLSPKQRRWPEDIAWHPEGNSVLAVYTADGGDNQIAMIDLSKTERDRVTFLEEKPHTKGIVNSIRFMPWDDIFFVSGGSDHSVVLWNDNDGKGMWRPKVLHKNLHSSAVMGVAGLHHKQVVMSTGADKRIVGFDLLAGRADYKHQIESKCMSILPNPRDLNLFLVQTGTPEQQLRLFDIRLREELHSFGWEQETSGSQSALINQAWSPDGLFITSGSADPKIHIFDIRYNSHKPSQSLQAHQKRVFKAVWHQSVPLLISISSDLTIGLHKIS